MKKFYLFLVVAFLSMAVNADISAQYQKNYPFSDTLITAAVNMINADSLESYMRQMEDMGTRFLMAENRRDVALWLKQKFVSFGVPEVRLDSFQCYTNINFPFMNYDTTTWQYNVEARIEGSEFPGEEVIVMGHYDNVMQEGDPLLGAPGADDNASGTAAALETARVIMNLDYQPRRTVIFLATGAEEFMYFGDAGSEHYAAEASTAGRNIVMVINNDMIAWNEGSWTIGISDHIPSRHITEMAISITENYTNLNYNLWPASYHVGADLQPFLDEGFPGVFFMEEEFNPYYHSANDVTDSCNIPYLTEVTKITCGLSLHADLTVGTTENESFGKNFSVYPNPAVEMIHLVNKTSSSDFILTVINDHGAELINLYLEEKKTDIDVSMLPSGMYYLIMRDENQISSIPLVIR